jgi:hypothetical protein
VVEGLSGTISRVEELDMFNGFKVVNNGLSVSHLSMQITRTLFFGEGLVENLWTL